MTTPRRLRRPEAKRAGDIGVWLWWRVFEQYLIANGKAIAAEHQHVD
jgi:hypothetical protein